MLDYKKVVAIFFLVASVFFISGCGQKKQSDGQDNRLRNFQRGENSSSTGRFFEMGTKVSPEDLEVGKQISVFGTTNSDGTVNAIRIMIGEQFGFMMRGATSTTGTPIGQPPTDSRQYDGQDRGQMKFNNQGRGGGRMMGGGGMIRGEIINKDDSMLVIKNQDGGSKIVFYSNKTEVFIFQPPTSTQTTSSVSEKI